MLVNKFEWGLEWKTVNLSFNQIAIWSDISVVAMVLWSHPVDPEEQSVLPRSPDAHLLRLRRHLHPAHRLFGSQRHQGVDHGEVGFLHRSQQEQFNHPTLITWV